MARRVSVTFDKKDSTSCLRVRLRGVTGRLKASSATPAGFELRKDAKSSMALPVSLQQVGFDPQDPAAILLKFKDPLTPPVCLYYGTDHEAQGNIMDEKDMSLPAFGPIKVRSSR